MFQHRELTKHFTLGTLLASLLFLSFYAQSSPAQNVLIEIEELKQTLNTPDLVIIDLREAKKYQQDHIPLAINIPFEQFQRKKNGVSGFVITPKRFKELMEQAGVKNIDQVVLYSDWYLESARIYWVFDLYGHHKIQVLNGGIQGWKEAKAPLERQANIRPPSHYIVEIKPDKLATKLQTLVAIHNTDDFIIIDARPEDQYQGKTSRTSRKGHIPNAINLPWYELVNNRNSYETMKLIDWQALQKKLALLPKNKKLLVYCNGGKESAILYMGLKQINRDASLYDGSWFEWSNDDSLPIQN